MKLNIEAWLKHVQDLERDIRAHDSYRKKLSRHLAKPDQSECPVSPKIPSLYARIGIEDWYKTPAGSEAREKNRILGEAVQAREGRGSPYMTMLYCLRAQMRKTPRVHCKGFTLEDQAVFLEKTRPLWEKFLMAESEITQEQTAA